MIDCVISGTKVTLISKSMLSITAALVLFSGCGSDSKNITKSDSVKAEAYSSKTLTSEGEAVDFYVSGDVDNIESYEWRDESGKLLTTDDRFNREFNKS